MDPPKMKETCSNQFPTQKTHGPTKLPPTGPHHSGLLELVVDPREVLLLPLLAQAAQGLQAALDKAWLFREKKAWAMNF